MISNDFKSLGHVGHHGVRRHQGKGGVHQVVDEIIYYHVLHHSSLFLPGNQLKMILCAQGHVGHSGGRRHEGQGGDHHVVDEFFLSYYTSFRPSFDGKLIASTQGDAGHQDGRQIKDKEESTRDLLDTMNTNYSEGNFK